jgi:phage shock protein PspC (stress-responsive transcriptional regulator)
MNKILNINLGGYALTIDDDAFEYLSAYLESIRRRFSESEGRDEILADIEARMGELITGDMGGRTIVMLPDVEAAIQIMGKPEDFGGEPIDNRRTIPGSGRRAAAGTATVRTGRRLFRDEEDAVAGGVCSGLSAYFGIADPVWMRLIFVLLTFITGGTWILAYVLLWVLVPKATTAADRLAMRGEPVNVDNIAREIEDGFDRFGNRVSAMGADLKKKSGAGGRSFTGFLGRLLAVIGRVFGLVLRFLAKFGVFILIAIAIGLLIGLMVSWLMGIWGLVVAAPYLDYVSPFNTSATFYGLFNLFFILGIPVVLLCLLFIRLLFKTRFPRWVAPALLVFWVLNLVSGAVMAGVGVKHFSQSAEVSKNVDLAGIPSDTLRLEWAGEKPNGETQPRWFHRREIHLDQEGLVLGDMVDIEIRRSRSGRFEYSQTIEAHGSTYEEALDNAGRTEFAVEQDGNTLRIPIHYAIPKGGKWRAQEVNITIGVPEGKSIVVGKVLSDRIRHSDYSETEDNDYYMFDYPDRVFHMTDDGLVCADCPKFGEKEYHGGRYYENFILEGNFNTEIREGNNFRISFEGAPNAKDLVKSIRTGNKLTLTTDGKELPSDVRVIIETPVFTDLIADDAGEVILRGFDEGQASITARGKTRIKAYLDSRTLDVSLSGPCSLDLTGSGHRLDATLSEGATLEASKWRGQDVEVTASDNSRARVFAEGDALIRSDASSEVKVEGDARVRKGRGQDQEPDNM